MEFFERQSCCRPSVLLLILFLPAVYLPEFRFPTALVLALGAVVSACLGGRATLRILLWALVLNLIWPLRASEPEPSWPFDASGRVSGRGTVWTEAPVARSGSVPFRLKITEVRREPWTGRADAVVRVAGYRGDPPAAGSRWVWSGRLTEDGTLIWLGGRTEGWAGPWWEGRARVRRGLSSALAPLGEGPAALGEALLIGAVDDLTPAEKQGFRDAGCSHVLALSGMHLSLLGLLLGAALKGRARPAVGFTVVQAVLGLFCFLAGPIPSLLRAWVMAFLAGWWGLSAAPVSPRELLAQSFLATVLLWPALASTLSLQLSFLALAGLLVWGEPWTRELRPWVGRWAAGQLGSSAAAVAATAPLVLALFGEVRLVGLVMTPPLVFLTTVFLFGTATVAAASMVPGFDAGWLAPVFQGLYDLTFLCTGWAARVPALPGGLAWAVLTVGGLGVGALFLYNGRRRRAPVPVSLNYDSPAALQAFLDDKGYNALKRWGQNFLINAGARRQILAALELQPGEPVWEVGPGLGALTHHLVAAGHPLTVFEIDPGYAGFLREEFGDAPAGFSLVEGDVVKTWKTQPLTGVKCVGNLPYNAASAIIADFVEGGFFPAVFVVTVQLEMAQRMTATPGHKNYSSFSVLCQSAFGLDDVVTLKPGSFYPAPEVTSRVVRLRPHHRYPGLDHRRFSVFVRECFSSRRKTLRNNLPGAASALKVSDEALTAAFAGAGVDLGLRAEVLSVAQFVQVFGLLNLPSA